MSADKDSAKPSGVNVSGEEMHSMLKELKPLLWAALGGLFIVSILALGGYLFIEHKRLEVQHGLVKPVEVESGGR